MSQQNIKSQGEIESERGGGRGDKKNQTIQLRNTMLLLICDFFHPFFACCSQMHSQLFFFIKPKLNLQKA